jgi:predicted flap endonuclease-1-like 5' DNA nuclease
MNLAEDIWLRSKAAQSSMMQLMAYNTAFAGTATLQAWKMGLTAPAGFWQAMGRATGAANAGDNVVTLEPPMAKKPRKAAAPKAKPAAVKALPVVDPVPLPEPPMDPVDPGPSPHLLDAPRGGKADDLTVLKGVGAKLATALNEFGIYHFDQIATLDDEGIDWLNEQQNGFKMIAARYDLVAQAKAKLPG